MRELVLTRDGGFSCLYVSGHLDVVKALLEAGGRELVMLTKGDGASCHYVSAENGHVDVVRACWQKRRRVLPHSPVPALPLKRQLIVPLQSAQRRRNLIVFNDTLEGPRAPAALLKASDKQLLTTLFNTSK